MANRPPGRNNSLLSQVMSWIIGGLIVLGVVAELIAGWLQPDMPGADPDDPEQVAIGKRIYDQYCAACHGEKLQGDPDWRKRLPSGKRPPPPHDETGHTWHHPDEVLFGITKYGLVPPYAPQDYESDMPAFKDVLTDEEIWAVLAYIKSTWPQEMRQYQAEVDEQARQRQ